MSHLNGVDLYHELGGDGPDLLFLNGSGATLETSAPLIDRLRRSFRVLAFDTRGLGRSGAVDAPYEMADLATDAFALLDHLGWQTCPVFGVSFGGMLALGSRSRRPTVSAPGPPLHVGGRFGGSSYPLHELADLPADERMAKTMTLVDSRFSPEWFADHPLDDAIIHARGERGRASIRRASRWRAASDASPGHARRVEPHRAHHVPDTGRVRPLRRHRAGGEQRVDGRPHPDAKLEVYEGGHMFFIQDPTAFPNVVAFLAEA